jgi:hypothetical protein
MGWPEMTSSLARESVHHTRSATAAQEHRATLARLAAVLRDPTGDEVNPTSHPPGKAAWPAAHWNELAAEERSLAVALEVARL